MWEIFPLRQRGTAMAVWGVGIMMAPILGPTVGGWLADNWSWRWIFYINIPIGIVGFLMVSAFLFDSPFVKKPRGIDAWGLVLMVAGFGGLQLAVDLGEKEDWFHSDLIVGLFTVALFALVGFVVRELRTSEPILDLNVFNDRNFTVGTLCIALVALGFNSSMLLLALYTQKILGYDAWNAGLVLAPGGLGTMIALMISGRLVSRMDQRLMLIGGCLLNAFASIQMTWLTLGMDYWSLAWPRFLQGFSSGFIFPPLHGPSAHRVRPAGNSRLVVEHGGARHRRHHRGDGRALRADAARSQTPARLSHGGEHRDHLYRARPRARVQGARHAVGRGAGAHRRPVPRVQPFRLQEPACSSAPAPCSTPPANATWSISAG